VEYFLWLRRGAPSAGPGSIEEAVGEA